MADRAAEIAEFMRDLRAAYMPTRFAAVACLGGLKAVEAIDELISILRNESEDELIRHRAVAALGEIGPAANRAAPLLMELYPLPLLSGDAGTAVLKALRAIGTPEAVAFVQARTGNEAGTGGSQDPPGMPCHTTSQVNDNSSASMIDLPKILREYRVKIIPAVEAKRLPGYPDNLGCRTKFGGVPEEIHESKPPPECPCCTAPMHFIAQIDSFEHMSSSNPNEKHWNEQHFNFGDVGMIYVWFCFDCCWPHATMETY